MAAMSDATIVSRAAATRSARGDDDRVIETSIPSRLDSLRWSGFHTRVVVALGVTWILDGLEVTLAGTLSGALKESPTLHFTNFDVGLSNSATVLGQYLPARLAIKAEITPRSPHRRGRQTKQPKARQARRLGSWSVAAAANPQGVRLVLAVVHRLLLFHYLSLPSALV